MGTIPVLSSDVLRDIARRALAMTSADTASIRLEHTAIGAARVEQSRLRLNDSGDRLHVEIATQFGHRQSAELVVNQLDDASLRDAMAYLERIAHEQLGDPTSLAVPIPPRTYLSNTTWKLPTVAAYDETRHGVMPALVDPLLRSGLAAAAFAGVYVRSTAYAEKTGIEAYGEETDAERTVTGWSSDGRGSGWAG